MRRKNHCHIKKEEEEEEKRIKIPLRSLGRKKKLLLFQSKQKKITNAQERKREKLITFET